MNARGHGSAQSAVLVFMLMVAATSPAAGQGLQAGDLRLDPTGRVQVQLNTTSVDEDDVAVAPASSAFETRRIRLGTTFTYGDWIEGKVEVDFSGGGARLTDGFADLAVTEEMGIRAGQFKKPFGLFELESSTKIRTIERGLRIRGVGELVGVAGETQSLLSGSDYLGRQIGVMAHGQVGRLGYAAGVFNGEGANTRETEASKAYAARLTYGVRDALVLGAAVSRQPTGSFDGSDEVHGTAVEVDAAWGGFRREGLTVMAELMRGGNALLTVSGGSPTMTGAHATVAWFEPWAGRVEGIEPVLRVSWADPDTDGLDDEGVLLTPGMNLYFNGRNRLMLNGDIYLPAQDGLDTEFAVVAQLQLHF